MIVHKLLKTHISMEFNGILGCFCTICMETYQNSRHPGAQTPPPPPPFLTFLPFNGMKIFSFDWNEWSILIEMDGNMRKALETRGTCIKSCKAVKESLYTPPTERKPIHPPTERKAYTPTNRKKAYPPTNRKKAYTPTNRKKAYTPTNRKKAYPPTNRKKAYPPTNRKKAYTPTNRKKAYTPTNRKKAYTPTNRKKAYTPTNRKKAYTPTNRKKAYTPTTEFGTTPIRRSFAFVKRCKIEMFCQRKRWAFQDTNEKEKDKIRSWESLIAYYNSFDLNIFSNDDYIRLCKLSDDTFPPKIIFAISIMKCYSVKAYSGLTLISLTDILKKSFQYKLTLFRNSAELLKKLKHRPWTYSMRAESGRSRINRWY